MKEIRTILAALLLAVSSPTFAQYNNYSYRSSERTYYSQQYDEYVEGWGSIYLEYAPLDLIWEEDAHEGKMRFNTFTIGANYNFQLGYSPIYVEVGMEASGAYFTERYDDVDDGRVKRSIDLYYAKIPINMVCRWNISEDFAIIPYAGCNLKINISAEERYRTDRGNYTYNLFDDYNMRDDDYCRFQAGFQGGIRFLFINTFYLGASYQGDFTPLYSDNYSKEKFRGFAFNIGYCF